MSPTLQRWFRRSSLVALVVYWLALLTGTHVPQPPPLMGLEQHDKVLHTSAYAGLAFLIALNVWWRTPLELKHFLIVFVVVAVSGGLNELTQPPFGRTADWFDWYADMSGAVIGLIFAAIVCRFLERYRVTKENGQ